MDLTHSHEILINYLTSSCVQWHPLHLLTLFHYLANNVLPVVLCVVTSFSLHYTLHCLIFTFHTVIDYVFIRKATIFFFGRLLSFESILSLTNWNHQFVTPIRWNEAIWRDEKAGVHKKSLDRPQSYPHTFFSRWKYAVTSPEMGFLRNGFSSLFWKDSNDNVR